MHSKQPEHFLLGGAQLPEVPILRQHGLSAYAYTKLPADHPSRSTLREAFLRATARHISVKANVLPLFRAWRAAGVEVLVFKGFYLAEFVYPSPSQRFYGDVDVLIRPEHSVRARAIAKATGWHEAWAREESLYANNHEESRLDLPGKIRLEMHRYIIDSHTPLDALQRRFTAAAWESSSEVAWEGTAIRVLQPSDSILIGLVLNRSWSAGDDWKLKPHDILDFKNLVERFGLSREALFARAKGLNCTRTLELFLARCNPWEGRLELREPTFWQKQRWSLVITPERGHLGLERFVIDVFLRLPFVISGLRYLPEVWRVRQLLRSEGDVPRILQELEAEAGPDKGERSLREEERIALGVKWGVRLLWPFRRDPCMPRSLALFAAYRKRGYPATFYCGKEHGDSGEKEHAWVSLAWRRLEDFLNVEKCGADEVGYRYPPASNAAMAAQSGEHILGDMSTHRL